jgi:hypothetical protein
MRRVVTRPEPGAEGAAAGHLIPRPLNRGAIRRIS